MINESGLNPYTGKRATRLLYNSLQPEKKSNHSQDRPKNEHNHAITLAQCSPGSLVGPLGVFVHVVDGSFSGTEIFGDLILLTSGAGAATVLIHVTNGRQRRLLSVGA